MVAGLEGKPKIDQALRGLAPPPPIPSGDMGSWLHVRRLRGNVVLPVSGSSHFAALDHRNVFTYLFFRPIH